MAAGSVTMTMEGSTLVLVPAEPVDDLSLRLMTDLATCAIERSVPVVIDLRLFRSAHELRRRMETMLDRLPSAIEPAFLH